MSKEDRFALLNTLSFNDKFFDNENEEYLDSLDVVRILNHYDKTLSEFVKRDVEQQDKISDIEAKLAGKETEYNKLKQCFDKASNNCTFDELREIILVGEENSNERVIKMLNEQVEALEQQLAEKDVDLSLARNEIDTLKHNLKVAQEHDKVMCESYFNTCNEAHQEKIEFALEQLSKTKNFINGQEIFSKYKCESKVCRDILQAIDNQIKQLKGED